MSSSLWSTLPCSVCGPKPCHFKYAITCRVLEAIRQEKKIDLDDLSFSCHIEAVMENEATDLAEINLALASESSEELIERAESLTVDLAFGKVILERVE